MPPNSESRVICGLSRKHSLAEDNVTLANEPLLFKFVKKMNPDFRSTTRVCRVCYDTLKKLYHYKMKRAVEKKSRTANTVSSVSNSSFSQEISAMHNEITSSQSSSTSSSNQPTTSAAAKRKHTLRETRAISNIQLPPPTTTTTSSTPSLTSSTSDEEYEPSPNAVNGTRLPHIQPIPKRRQFVHAHPVIMDMYLQGTTGG